MDKDIPIKANRLAYTQITYNKTSCYFCNDWFENEQIKDHLIVCGQVLEKCSNNCGAYLQRKDIEKHTQKCEKIVNRINDKDKDDGIQPIKPNYRLINEMEKRLEMMQEDLSSLRSTINDEIRQRLRLITDVGSLRKRNQLTDAWTHKVGDILATLKKCVNEETESRCIDIQKCRQDLSNLLQKNNQAEDWRVQMTMKLNEVQNEVVQEENVRALVDVLMHDNRISVAKIKNMEIKMEELKQTRLVGNRNSGGREFAIISDQIASVGMMLDSHRKHLEAFTGDTNQQLDEFNSKILTTDAAVLEVVSKISSLDFELKSLKYIVHESEDKCEKLEKIVDRYRHETYYTKQRIDDVEENSKYQKHLQGIVNTTGHLIWRIDEYSAKLSEAKENEITIKSPMFTNTHYGYTLRLEVNLNGIGTWRGRNMIACLSVIYGEYDPLLQWPCTLKADIILRDQPDDIGAAQNFSKTIVTKRKNEKYEKSQYIHIPHTVISGQHYIKNDTIFLEVIVHESVF